MGRLVKIGTAGKDRLLLEKGIVLAIGQLSRQSGMDETTRDLLAYIALSLISIGKTIDDSVAAWEKRGYWVKADRYRMEWDWTGQRGEQMKQAIIDEDWAEVARIVGLATQKLSMIKITQKNRMDTPWIGSYKKLISSNHPG